MVKTRVIRIRSSDRRSKRAWWYCLLRIPFILSGGANEYWPHTCDAFIITTWRLGLRAPLVVHNEFGVYSRNLKKALKILWITFWKFYFHIYYSRAKTADLITDALEFMYTPWPGSSNVYALRSQLLNVLSDLMFFAPSHEVAAIQSQVSPVYMFEFAHHSKVSFGSEWMGVVHANNIMYDFGVPFNCRVRHLITMQPTETWACLSWPCTQTSSERVIRHHNQSPVLRWGNLILVTELSWKSKSVPRWWHHFILDECPFGMIIIPNWNKWSLMKRKSNLITAVIS